jgi:Fe-S-cluster-containing hydrogenase component 2
VTYIIAEPCIDIKDRSCVDVCPVDCIHEADRILVIDPEECIDCGACLPECPIEAIVETEEESPDWAVVNKDLTPAFKGNAPVTPRPANDPPKKPGNKLRSS